MSILVMLKSAARGAYALWMRFAHLLAVGNTTLLLTLVYFLVIGPAHLVLRVLGKDPLDRKWTPGGSYWRKKEPVADTVEHVRRQF